MIESITLSSVATYTDKPVVMEGLSKVNFIFGSNGTGKTTISSVVADSERFEHCNVHWQGSDALQTMVYNRDFVETNYNQLKGVFTLGEGHVTAHQQIKTVRGEQKELKKKLVHLQNALDGDDEHGGIKEELDKLDADFKDKCWAQKLKHDENLSGALEGYRNDSKKFKNKILHEYTTNTSTLEPLELLQEKAETVFDSKPKIELLLIQVEPQCLMNYESLPILGKVVVGKDNVDIAGMIKKLSNSDWVREGVRYYHINDNLCPFCQQSTEEAFAVSLNEYFDDSFERDTKEIDELYSNYSSDVSIEEQKISQAIASNSKYLDIDRLMRERELFESIASANLQKISQKQKEPSKVVVLESVADVLGVVSRLIVEANSKILSRNEIIRGLKDERDKLTAQVWKYLVGVELKSELKAYTQKHTDLMRSITSINEKLTLTEEEIKEKEWEVQELERETTSIQPTIVAINSLLESFGFHGFSLAKAADGRTYKLVREDGSDAQDNLSEGEKTFVTFLYFYSLIKGSNTEASITNDRVVVFDDPVSSLDSDILFIVSSLIKGLFEEVCTNTGYVKQVFVLTHNVYFHKEVTFNSQRSGNAALRDETFWVVRKLGNISKLERHPSNPIKTSYDLLWEEVRREDKSHHTIQNTLRRILENYFKFFGGIEPRMICKSFEGKDQMLCNSLLSWINDGSHYAHDDLFITMNEDVVESYLRVFKQIFEKSGHPGHYSMMMRDAIVDDSESLAEV